MRNCVLITVLALLTQVESGYEYQMPGVAWVAQGGQQPNGHLAQDSQSFTLDPQKSISNSQYQYNRQYQTSSYHNVLHNNNFNNALANQIQSGSVSQNVQQIVSGDTHPVQPIVTKHIYFHVPPPDEDIRPVQPPLVAKRKSYNIIFIKVPSIKVRNNPYAATEAKTIIYVLVKNPEDQSKALTVSKPNHEVFYVKYKGSVTKPAAQINSNSVFFQRSPERELRPGLVNGQ